MSQINEILSTLRKKIGLTQEELGARLGVSAQSISKWENSVSMPDICLLPMIAETLGVSIDTLFGIDNTSTVKATDDYPAKIHERILESIASWFGEANAKEAYKKYTDANHEDALCVIFTKEGAVFENKSIGIVFPQAPEEAVKLLKNQEAKDFISLLSDPAVLATVDHLVTSKQFATVASIANRSNLTENTVRSSLEKLKKYQLVNHQRIDLEDETVEVFRIQRTHALLFIYAILAIAKQAAATIENYLYYRGNEQWCY